jgi:hypothetical protein
MKKKPVSITRGAHAPHDTPAAAAAAAGSSGIEQPPASGSWATASVDTPAWIQSVAVCPMADLVASGAGDGFLRLWGVQPSKHGGAGALKQVCAICISGVWATLLGAGVTFGGLYVNTSAQSRELARSVCGCVPHL